MNKAIAAIVIVVVVVAGIYLVTRPKMNSQNSVPTTAQTQQPSTSNGNAGVAANNPTPASQSIIVPISTQNNSGEAGTAVFTDENGKTKVSVTINGEPSGATQPSHIHVGSCATPGPAGAVKYTLSPLVSGKAETTVDVSLSDLLKSLPLMINFHKSAAEITVYTACGDIVSAANIPPASSNPNPSPVAPTPAPQPTPTSTPPASSSGSGGGNFGY